MAATIEHTWNSNPGNRNWAGDMSRDMFPQNDLSQIPDANTDFRTKEPYDYKTHLVRCIMDRRDAPRSKFAYEEKSNSNNWLTPVMNVHMYGATDTTDPWTDEEYDSQFRDKDPRGFNLQIPYWKYPKMFKDMVLQFYDWSKGGDYNEIDSVMSGAERADLPKKFIEASKVLFKNFQEGLGNVIQKYLLTTPRDKNPYVFDVSSQTFENPTLNQVRDFSHIVNPDINFRSMTTIDTVPDISTLRTLPTTGIPPTYKYDMNMIDNTNDNMLSLIHI